MARSCMFVVWSKKKNIYIYKNRAGFLPLSEIQCGNFLGLFCNENNYSCGFELNCEPGNWTAAREQLSAIERSPAASLLSAANT